MYSRPSLCDYLTASMGRGFEVSTFSTCFQQQIQQNELVLE